MPKNPMDAIDRIVDDKIGTGLFQYFIKVIPTTFKDSFNFVTRTNQFTVTEKFRPLKTMDEHGQESMVAFSLFSSIFLF
jgi:Endoplasmic reticulum vesicle transporter